MIINFLQKIYHLLPVSIRQSIGNWNIVQNLKFFYQHRRLVKKHKFIYALTPPPYLANVGDHAQVVAIRAWFKRHYPETPVIELDKNQAQCYLLALRWLVRSNDLVFLHSGGNLGDRGIWSESIRRMLISTFPKNQIVSLPQTIYFSDSPIGVKERDNTRNIYFQHPNLTVIARDPESEKLAIDLFPKAKIFCMPDFVLSLPPRLSVKNQGAPHVLLCLRLDNESALTTSDREKLIVSIPYSRTIFDTTLPKPISLHEQTLVLNQTLDLFSRADIVITDRYHGLIFAVLCRKPCIVIGTVDHKLTSAMSWFTEIPCIVLTKSIEAIPTLVKQYLQVECRQIPDWNQLYFDKIPALIKKQ